MNKYNKEIRLKVVHEVLENGLSENEAARKYGMNHVTVNQWVAAYINNGEHGMVDKTTKRTFTGEQKLFILEDMHNNQLSYKGASKKHGIADSAIRKWKKQYLTDGADSLYIDRRGRKKSNSEPVQPAGSNVDSVEDMEQENRRLRMEVDYLKKLHALVQEKRKLRMRKRL
ncbi:transposase [Paenibacillus sp. L3-i20]|uniref:transposase n=1 Tax=Paenibacillus sp. L3-i20 TaxID=2905833 RepID=UPI001EDF5183|nr:transposase [Paenibacillus sp. L3-i20]GKU79841.1 transposase [Paenibacillus sp. L3-i20]